MRWIDKRPSAALPRQRSAQRSWLRILRTPLICPLFYLVLPILGTISGCANGADEPTDATSKATATRPVTGPLSSGSVAKPVAAAPDIFAAWLNFEPEEARNSAQYRKFFIDALLGHQVFRLPPRGAPAHVARRLLLDDDELLLPSGKRLWNRKLTHQTGLAGEFCFIHSTYCVRRIFDVRFVVDGKPVVVYDNQYAIRRFPSHTTVSYSIAGVNIDEHKLISYDDRAIVSYEARSADGKDHTLTIEALVDYPRLPRSDTEPKYPLLGAGHYQGNRLFLYLEAPGFERYPSATIHLNRGLRLPASGDVSESATLALRFEIEARDEPREPIPHLIEHASRYNKWFADNIPYFDCSDGSFKKMWYYRWWIVRFHMVDLRDGRTTDLQDYAFYEGKLGFDNPIGFAIPAQIKELTYLRNPVYAISQLRNSYGNLADNGAVVDPPGSPYWHETYSHWNAQAAAELNRVHPLDKETLDQLLPLMAKDVRAWMTSYDADQDFLPERIRPRVTGYDLDILSWWYWAGTKLDQRHRPPAMERVDFASFLYANASGITELARAAGNPALAKEFRTVADNIRTAAVQKLWDDETFFFYPQRADDDERAPIRELHGLFPFTTLMAPNEPRFTRALQRIVDPAEFWSRFPPVITSMHHYRDWNWERDGLTRNIAPHPISMGGRTLIQAVRNYDQSSVRPKHVMELLARYNDLVYPGVYPGNPIWRPNAHEYYSQWEPFAREPEPKPSEISHDFHSMWLSLVIEGAIGLIPRGDDVIEVDPMATEWSYFLIDRLRYHGRDLTIAWDRPGDGPPRYDGVPEGLSIQVNGKQVAHRPDMGKLKAVLGAREG